MAVFNTYLNFHGKTEEAFNFYKSVFGGEFVMLMRYADASSYEGGFGMDVNFSEEDKQKIMHIALPVGNGNMLMGTDNLECLGQQLVVGNNFSISISVDSEEEADKLFDGLSKEGNISMPMAKAFWGDYFGMLTDKYGIQWMVSYTYDQPQQLAEKKADLQTA